MNRTHIALLSTVLGLSSFSALAVNDQQIDVVKALGELNGVALKCKHLDQTQKMKKAMVDHLPKLRVLGDVFDQASNDSFLNMSTQGILCPTKSEFHSQVDRGIDQLATQFQRDK